MLFIIEYDRNRGNLVSLKRFETAERTTAENVRLEMEIELNRRGIEREVVLFEAETEAALRRTHRRYFESLSELVALP